DKPVPEVAQEHTRTEESEIVDTQIAGATAASAGAGEQELLELIKVIDGDTIAIQKGGSSETVRMIGLNAPETGTCYTGEATQKLKNLLASGKVSLELDASQGERDKYDRLLAYVFSESGVNTAKALIEGGFAKEYTYSKAYKYQTEFKTAQTSAQTAQKGLWAPGVCAKPAAAPAQTVVAPPPTTPAAKSEPVATQVVEKEEKPEEEEEEQEEDPTPAPPPPKASGGYTCSSNTYNCSDFSTHAEAQAVYESCGGASNDIHRLDANKDGEACESLP
ncbi:MAG: thermonuclease family protein, partial [Candidatus Adlerbacteria bacterium]|nr:thermonuclease family protein [Candidatus Adlerbacteria bacterium]